MIRQSIMSMESQSPTLFNVIDAFLGYNLIDNDEEDVSYSETSNNNDSNVNDIFKNNTFTQGQVEDYLCHNFSIHYNFIGNTLHENYPLVCLDTDEGLFDENHNLLFDYAYSRNVIHIINPKYGYRLIVSHDYASKIKNFTSYKKYKFKYKTKYGVIRDGPYIVISNNPMYYYKNEMECLNMQDEYVVFKSVDEHVKYILTEPFMENDIRFLLR